MAKCDSGFQLKMIYEVMVAEVQENTIGKAWFMFPTPIIGNKTFHDNAPDSDSATSSCLFTHKMKNGGRV